VNRFLFAAAILLLAAAALAQTPTGPGGRFEERVRAVEKQVGGQQPVVTIRTKPARPAAAARPAAPRRAGRTVTRPAPTVTRPARTAISRPAPRRQRVAAVRQVRSAPVRRVVPAPPAWRTGEITYSVDPRADRPSSPLTTGDVVLFAQPGNVRVRYRWDGGIRNTAGTMILKGLLPQHLEVHAEAPEIRGRASGWIPVKSGCITTVRFVFPCPGSGWSVEGRLCRSMRAFVRLRPLARRVCPGSFHVLWGLAARNQTGGVEGEPAVAQVLGHNPPRPT
jgi:hypothetical protein